jgi:lysine/ornithine N-monooxygenase
VGPAGAGMSRPGVVIVGAGPYGLSLAAHLHGRGAPFRIFGKPFDTWRNHMPNGMFLKSEGFASNLSDPAGTLTLRRFAAEHGHPYADIGLPVPIDLFTQYGDWFREHAVPEVETVEVVQIHRRNGGFAVEPASGPPVETRRVVLAVGVGAFAHVPTELRDLGQQHLSHPFDHATFGAFEKQDVAVIGAGQSALETAALLYESGARPTVVCRCDALAWNPAPPPDPRLTWSMTELGRGWKFRAYTAVPGAFRRLPDHTRARIVRTALGPAGAWWLRERLTSVPLLTGTRILGASVSSGKVVLELQTADGARELAVDHVIAATGYRVDVDRIGILAPELRAEIARANGSPRLNRRFESTAPGLHFVGLAAANSFGPAMRFVFGSAFAARRVTAAVA